MRDRISAAHWVLQKPPVRGTETSLASSRQEDWLEAQLSNWLTETSGEVMQFRHYCWLKLGDCCQKVFILFEWGVSREKQVFLGILYAYALLVVLHYRLSQNPVWDTWAPLRKSIAIRNSARKVSEGLFSSFYLSECPYACFVVYDAKTNFFFFSYKRKDIGGMGLLHLDRLEVSNSVVYCLILHCFQFSLCI